MKLRLALLWFSVAVAPALVVAQEAQPCLKVKKIWMSSNAVPQGGVLDVKLQLITNRGCRLLTADTYLAPSNDLYIDPASGYRLVGSSADYQGLKRSKAHGALARRITYRLKLLASADLQTGESQMPVVIVYKAADQAGTIADQRMELTLAVPVAPAGTPVKANPERSVWETVGDVAVTVAISPIMLLVTLGYYLFTGHGWER